MPRGPNKNKKEAAAAAAAARASKEQKDDIEGEQSEEIDEESDHEMEAVAAAPAVVAAAAPAAAPAGDSMAAMMAMFSNLMGNQMQKMQEQMQQQMQQQQQQMQLKIDTVAAQAVRQSHVPAHRSYLPLLRMSLHVSHQFPLFVWYYVFCAPLIETLESTEGQMTPDAGTPRREGEVREILDELRRNQAEEREKAAMEAERKIQALKEEREKAAMEAERKIQALKEEQQRILYEKHQQKIKHDEELRLAKEAAIATIYCSCSTGGCTIGRACKCSSKPCTSRCRCRGDASVCQNDNTLGVKEYRARLKEFAASISPPASPAPALASSSSPMKPISQMSKEEINAYLARLNAQESVNNQQCTRAIWPVSFIFSLISLDFCAFRVFLSQVERTTLLSRR